MKNKYLQLLHRFMILTAWHHIHIHMYLNVRRQMLSHFSRSVFSIRLHGRIYLRTSTVSSRETITRLSTKLEPFRDHRSQIRNAINSEWLKYYRENIGYIGKLNPSSMSEAINFLNVHFRIVPSKIWNAVIH